MSVATMVRRKHFRHEGIVSLSGGFSSRNERATEVAFLGPVGRIVDTQGPPSPYQVAFRAGINVQSQLLVEHDTRGHHVNFR